MNVTTREYSPFSLHWTGFSHVKTPSTQKALSSALRAIGPRKSIPVVYTLISTKKDPQITFVTPAGLRSPAFYSYLFHCSRISLNIYHLILRILRQISRKNRTFRIRLSKNIIPFIISTVQERTPV